MEKSLDEGKKLDKNTYSKNFNLYGKSASHTTKKQ